MSIVINIETARKRRAEQDRRLADLIVARQARLAEHEAALEAIDDFFDWEVAT